MSSWTWLSILSSNLNFNKLYILFHVQDSFIPHFNNALFANEIHSFVAFIFRARKIKALLKTPAHLIIPPFKNKSKQIPHSIIIRTCGSACLKIHVERQMEWIKKIRSWVWLHSSKILKICVALSILLPQLCKIPEYDII